MNAKTRKEKVMERESLRWKWSQFDGLGCFDQIPEDRISPNFGQMIEGSNF